MADQAMPNVAGKGPTLMREVLATLKEVGGNGAADKIKALCTDRVQEMEPLVTRAYMKTVKAAEVAWECNQMAISLKNSLAAGNQAAAVETAAKLDAALDDLINKIKSFVIRMT